MMTALCPASMPGIFSETSEIAERVSPRSAKTTKPSVGSTGLVINLRSLEMFTTHFFSSCMIMPFRV